MTTKGRLVLLALGGLAYAVLSHVLMVRAADAPWAVAALVGPALFMFTGMALQKRHRLALWLCGAAWVGVAAVALAGGVGDVNRLYLVQHAGIHLALGVSFAATLRNRLSMVGEIAERVHGELPPAMVRYTHRVTLVWCGYFFSMVVLSCWVYAVRPWAEWSLLANAVTPAAITLLFVGEYLLRYRLHPEFDRATLADAWRAYQQPLRRDGTVQP
jgi:uncharacterized membrane protein